MLKLVPVLLAIVFVAKCQRPAAIAPAEPGGLPARAQRLEPVSKDDAIRLAKDYLRTEHPEIVIADRPVTAEYLEKSPIDGKPLWVVHFAASTKDAKGFVPFYSQTVFVRNDKSVSLGPAASSSVTAEADTAPRRAD
jgi:hypothetical protein